MKEIRFTGCGVRTSERRRRAQKEGCRSRSAVLVLWSVGMWVVMSQGGGSFFALGLNPINPAGYGSMEIV